jgi:type VI secretion system secreted protein VgrG
MGMSMKDIFSFTAAGVPAKSRVVGFRGTEALSKPYAFEVYLAVPDGEDFKTADAIGGKATLTLDRDDGRAPFLFHGILATLELLHHADGQALVQATLVPRLWRLTLTHHSRMFTEQSIPDIVKAVLEDGGLTPDDYVFKLSRTYAPQEHVCQYQESHLAFVSRWLEREGMYYYFEQGDAHERLVITDAKSFHEALSAEPIRFFALAGADATARECLHTFTCRHTSLPGKVRLKDYDHLKPTLDVSGSAPVSKTGAGEVSVYGARFFDPDDGKRLAKLRAEELLARELVYRGTGSSFFLRTGYTFALEDHPRQEFDTAYLATEVEHYGNQGAAHPEFRRLTGLDRDDVYHVELTAIREAVQFRAESRTAWPRVYGFENGVIDGEADSDYAQLDEHGRYRVRLGFDESELADGKASTWVRMLQPHGGDVEGWHFPLRKGTEVLLTFLGGDPDRPVIAGAVPNAHQPSPVTKANHTKNVIQTGGKNRVEMEDKAGQQRITVSTPYANTMIRMGSPNADHNMIIKTDGATLLDAGKDWDVSVGGNLKECVTGTTNETYTGAHVTQSWADRTIEVGGAYHQNCHSPVTRMVYANSSTTITGNVGETYGPQRLIVNGNRGVEVNGNMSHTIAGEWNSTVDGSYSVTVSGGTKQVSAGSVSHFRFDNHFSVTAGFTSDTTIGVKNSNLVGGEVKVLVGTSLSLKAAGELSLTMGASIAIDAALKLSLMPLDIKEANVSLKASAAADLKNSPIAFFNLGALLVS